MSKWLNDDCVCWHVCGDFSVINIAKASSLYGPVLICLIVREQAYMMGNDENTHDLLKKKIIMKGMIYYF